MFLRLTIAIFICAANTVWAVRSVNGGVIIVVIVVIPIGIRMTRSHDDRVQ